MGFFLALGSLVIIAITGALGILSAIRKDPVWKDWLLGSLAGFLLFFISLFIIPEPTATVSPQQTVEPGQQQTTGSAVYK
ncbi:hypothetical protein Psch_04230 [Pelotomaculum schinkii]|uniref:Uncharacterized protein n=1 Tax=Pelotomaculum schinkii TaxID=78350 RepID=A0A4Y7R644_9FIRM|nr:MULTISPECIES: hypothetical protein [Pelotomaculum]TEB04101.1 hypothetical protein Psch_04230 [Pelotomaculum schinkii]TEB10429.1 hypothetical protein Psfp_04170 [Pelotomaculum sp. FP]